MSELEIWNELGNIYSSTGANNEAIHAYQKVIKLNPGFGQPYSNLASIFIGQGRYAEAIPMFQRGIELMDKSMGKAFLWNQLGDAYRKLEDYANASASYRKALELEPDDAIFHKNLAEVEQASRILASESTIDTDRASLLSSKKETSEVSPPGNEGIAKSEPANACWVFEQNKPASLVDENSSDTSEPSPVILGSRILSEASVDEAASENPPSFKVGEVPEQAIPEVSDNTSSPRIKEMDTIDLAGGTLPVDPPETVESIDTGARGLLRLGIQHWRNGEDEVAIHFLKIALEAAARYHNLFQEALCHYTIAKVETDLGKIEDAIQSFQSAANLAPERIFPGNNLGNLYCILDHYEDARAAFQEAIEHNPKDSVSWNGLGDVYHKLGRQEDAIKAYQLGNVFEKQGTDEDVLEEFEENSDSDLENPHVWKEAGNIYYDIGAYDAAIASYRKAIELDPSNNGFQASLTKAEEAKTIHPDLARIEQAQEAEPIPGEDSSLPDGVADPEPEAAYWVFKTVTPQGNAQQSADYYIPAVAETGLSNVKPLPALEQQTRHERTFSAGQVLPYNNQGHTNVLIQMAPRVVKPARTEEIINKPFTQHDQAKPSVEMDLGVYETSSVVTQSRTGNSTPQAIAKRNQAADQPSPNLQILENDLAAYRRVTEINPKNDRAWDALGNIYEKVGLHSQAIAAFEQAIELNPTKEVYHYHLGIALAYQMHYDEAIQAFQRVVDLNPDYVLAHCALACYYRRLGKGDEAQEHIKLARPSMENENEYNRACFESISGNADRAIELLEICLEKLQVQPAMIRSDPDLDFIRNDPRFEAMLNKNRLTGR